MIERFYYAKEILNHLLVFGMTLPVGYLEIGESAAEGTIRETWEEACAEVEVISPFAQLDIPLIGQVRISILNLLLYLMYIYGRCLCVLTFMEDVYI
ncbi:hypothetical protein CXB51_034486 [Gossypium anomalum]|uniref:Nudix hydrolase domain-containing protein n=1 Tax=Gossypium anomalum TaxID=47600 RepID=A0A8J5Y0N6_9ROSI|nr:hypothetical protein CXB51_034486 [Gossypium anomalum]